VQATSRTSSAGPSETLKLRLSGDLDRRPCPVDPAV
jgi:hypothetical protein